jgi:hypothetical protein
VRIEELRARWLVITGRSDGFVCADPRRDYE